MTHIYQFTSTETSPEVGFTLDSRLPGTGKLSNIFRPEADSPSLGDYENHKIYTQNQMNQTLTQWPNGLGIQQKIVQ